MKICRLKKGSDFRLRSGHPWVFSNELLESPRGIRPGELIEVQDLRGNFMARGYGNPNSLIAFRALSFDSHVVDPSSLEMIVNKLLKSWKNRNLLGFSKSFRLCFSEGDYIPGLIIDRYLIQQNQQQYQVFSYQVLTYGIHVLLNDVESLFKSLVEKAISQEFSDIPWERTILLSRNDVNIRKLEGLEVEAPKVILNPDNLDLNEVQILIQSISDPSQDVVFTVNLIEGQKTGFFLDQTLNMRLLIEALRPRLKNLKGQPLRVLDLCCYMGQWSAQLAAFFKQQGVQAEFTLVDISDLALKMARKNLESFDFKIETKKMDVLTDLVAFPDHKFDVVISDPPAFVKNKKDIETGLHGYMKLNQQAFRVAQHSGLVVSCTCSGLIQMVDFKNSLRKGLVRSGQKAKLISEGGLGWDHPQLIQFPEGQYLKMLLHTVE